MTCYRPFLRRDRFFAPMLGVALLVLALTILRVFAPFTLERHARFGAGLTGGALAAMALGGVAAERVLDAVCVVNADGLIGGAKSSLTRILAAACTTAAFASVCMGALPSHSTPGFDSYS